MNAEQMRLCLRMIANAYPQDAGKWTADRTAVWSASLVDLDPQRLKLAIEIWIASNRWAPTIAELRELALGAEARSGLDAWGDVVAEIHAVGSWGAPGFKDPLVAESVRMMGGWASICQSTSEPYDRKEFARIYDTLADRQRKEMLIPEPIRRQFLDAAVERMGLPQ